MNIPLKGQQDGLMGLLKWIYHFAEPGPSTHEEDSIAPGEGRYSHASSGEVAVSSF